MQWKKVLFQICLICCLSLVGLTSGIASTNISGNLTVSTTWTTAGSPYIVSGNFIVAGTTAQALPILTINAGVQVQFANGAYMSIGGNSSTNRGGLIATGVHFTSDDAFPTPGAWSGILFQPYSEDTLCRLTRCVIEYATINIHASLSMPTFNYCTVQNAETYGLYAQGAGGYPAVNTTLFTNNGDYPVRVLAEGVRKLVGCSFLSNTRQGILVAEDVITTSCRWISYGVPYVLSGNISVYNSGAGCVLNIFPTVIVKFATVNSSLQIGGNSSTQIGGLVASGAYFTSINDDFNGDTYGDGTTTKPSIYDWKNIYFNQYAVATSKLERCVVRFGGSVGGLIYVDGSTPTFSYCTMSSSGQAGIYGANHGYPTISTCLFANILSFPIYIQAEGVRKITGCSFINNRNQGIAIGYNGSDNVITSCTWTNQGVPYVIANSVSVYTTGGGSVLTFEPGVLMKFAASGSLHIGSSDSTCSGGLIATGVYFTSLKDDLVGGDTNGDTTATSPAPGDWDTLNFYPYLISSTKLEKCVLKYGGEYGQTINVRGSSAAFSTCTISYSGQYGIFAWALGYPTVINCIFDNNGDYPISVQAEGIRKITGCTFTNNTRQGIEVRSDNVITSCTWTNPGIPYVINGDVVVYADSPGCMLNLDPGVILKFADSYSELDIAGSSLNQVGGLNATGVIFTSIKDDDVGGDTYADGTATRPSSGDWWNIYFDDYTIASTKLDKCIIRYGGYSNSGMLYVDGCAPTFSYCTINDSDEHGIYGDSKGYPTVSNCRFENNQDYPISLQAEGIRKVTGNSFNANKRQAIEVRDDIVITSALWTNQGAPYVINGNVSVYTSGSGAILTLNSGVVVKFYDQYSQLNIAGSDSTKKGGLLATGVWFTSLKDDSIGGDTYGDGTTTSPTPGNWECIYFDRYTLATTKLESCVIRYGSYTYSGELYVNACTPTFSYCTINYSKEHGIYGVSSAYPVVSNCRFENNQDFPVSLEAEGIRKVTGSSFSNNKRSAIEAKTDTVFTSGTWTNQGAPYVINGNVSVYTTGSGAILTLNSGVVVKFYDQYSQLNIAGSDSTKKGGLLATGVYFTSLRDDIIGGDTNGDTTASSPDVGDWDTILFDKYTLSTTKLDRCVIRYGGNYHHGEILSYGCSPTFSYCTIDYAVVHGIFGSDKGYPTVSNCVFRNNQDFPVSLEAEGIRKITGCSFSNNGCQGIEALNDIVVTSGTWANQGIPYVITGTVSVYTSGSGAILTLNPGVVVKFSDIYSKLYIAGSSTTLKGGLLATGVYFTSLKDDSIGGDTYGDGTTTSPAPGDWDTLNFGQYTLSTTKLDRCVVRYGSYSYSGELYVNSCAPTFSYCTIDYSKVHGIYAFSQGYPTVSNCVFRNNQDYPVSIEAEGIRKVTGSSFSNNKRQGIEARADTVITSGTWTNQGVPYVIDGTVSIYTTGSGSILTLPAGVVIKFADINSELRVAGADTTQKGGLIAQGSVYAPVYFTSIKDDSIGGDTYGDGTTTSPAPGNWADLYFGGNTLPSSVLDHCVLRYGGYSNYANIALFNLAQPTIRYCLIEKGLYYGIYCYNAQPYLHHNTIINNNSVGILNAGSNGPNQIENNSLAQNAIGFRSLATIAAIFKYNNISKNTTYGAENTSTSVTLSGEFNWWGDTTGPYDGSTVGLSNPFGKGDTVSNYIDYDPWLRENPEQPRRFPDIKLLKGYQQDEVLDLDRYILDTAASWSWSTNPSVDQARVVINPDNTVDYTLSRTTAFVGLDSVAYCANWYAKSTSWLKYSTYLFDRLGDAIIDNGNEVENCWLDLRDGIIKDASSASPTYYRVTTKYDDAADNGKLNVTLSGSTAEIIPSSALKSPATIIFTVLKDTTGSDYDKQLLRVYEIVNKSGHFGAPGDTTQWYFEVYGDGSSAGTLSWVTAYSDGDGIAKIMQSPGQKGKISQVFTVPKPGWYTAIARVATDIGSASKQQKIYLYLQELNASNQIIEVANQVISSGAGTFSGAGFYRNLAISYYAKGTVLGVQVVAINPGSSGVSGSLYIDNVWVYPGSPWVTRSYGATQIPIVNGSFDTSAAGWMVEVYGNGSGTGTWSWDTGWLGKSGVFKVVQSGGQKGQASQLFNFPSEERNASASVWVYSSATSSGNTQKVYLYLYSFDSSYATVIESGNAILQPGMWTPNQWREVKFGYTPISSNNAVQIVAINQSGKPSANIYFDDIAVNQDQDFIYYWDHTLF
jgi:parallel beta-helix repeat protein